jgi:hypothetical protein
MKFTDEYPKKPTYSFASYPLLLQFWIRKLPQEANFILAMFSISTFDLLCHPRQWPTTPPFPKDFSLFHAHFPLPPFKFILSGFGHHNPHSSYNISIQFIHFSKPKKQKKILISFSKSFSRFA